MQQRNLRQDRHPAHATEVRENIVPCMLHLIHCCNLMLSDMIVAPTEHSSVDLHPARACLFLHEDVVAKTLQFERELKQWRLSEIQAGRGDPGRPPYEYVFLVSVIVLSFANLKQGRYTAPNHTRPTAGMRAHSIRSLSATAPILRLLPSSVKHSALESTPRIPTHFRW
jgi:hypothetical protein